MVIIGSDASAGIVLVIDRSPGVYGKAASSEIGSDQRADAANLRSRRAPMIVKGQHIRKYSAPTTPKTVNG
jgi:hypothetical protein